MKYIRTKDGRIIDIEKFKKQFDFQSCIYEDIETIFWKDACKYPERHKQGIKARTLKQADTIEELCDEFVLIHTEYDNSKDIFEARSSGTWLQHRGDNYYSFGLEQVRSGKMNIKGSTLYGAIWTEWGLKYVAKMNDKGELELL